MAVRREEGRGWMVDVTITFPDGRQERRKKKSPVQTRRGAEAFERQLREEMLNPSPPPPEGTKKEVPTLLKFAGEFIEEYAKNENKPSEIRSKESILRCHLVPALGHLRLDEIGVRDIAKLKTKLRSGDLSDKTIKNVLAVLSKMLHYAEECAVIDRIPHIKMPRVPTPDFDFLDFGEADRLLKAAEYQPDWHVMILVALRTGLRYGELCELRWPDVDLKVGRILVRRSFTRGQVTTPKNGKTREIPLSSSAVRALKEHRHLRGELVFCKADGGRRIHRRADVHIKKFARLAGLRSIGWHVLRHSFASHLAMRGRSLKEIQELLGHADFSQTLRYAHLAPAIKREAVETLDAPESAPARPIRVPNASRPVGKAPTGREH